MIHKLWLVLLAGGFVYCTPASAQTYTIKFKESGPGETVRVKVAELSDSKVRVVDGNDNELENKTEKKSETFDFFETIIDRPAGAKAANKLKRQYETAQRVEDGLKTILPYQGKTVLIEKKDGKYRFQIEGGAELEGKDAEELDEEFNKSDFKNLSYDLFLPKKPVAINEVWKMDGGPILKELEKGEKIELDAGKSVMTGKLLKAYKKDGRQFGVIEFTMEIALKSLTEDTVKIKVKDSKFIIKGQIDGCIDGSLETGAMKGTMQIDIRGEFAVNCLQFRITVQGQGTMSESREEVTKK